MTKTNKKPIPFLDAAADFHKRKKTWIQALTKIGETGRFILGEQVKTFETKAANFLGANNAITLANGTDALILALRLAGVKEKDEVITTPFSFFASSGAICRLGAKPIFADINPRSFAIAPDKIESRITKKTRAILPVHLYGAPANMTAIAEIARRHRLAVVEDAAQSFGARWKDKYVGAWGDAAAFSFYPTKVLGAYGDGGMLTTADASWASRARRLANHGQDRLFHHTEIGGNSRLDEVQAALLLAKLAGIKDDIAARQNIARLYGEALADISDIVLPEKSEGGEHVFGLYTLRAPSGARTRLAEIFEREGIGFGIYYPCPLHLQPALSFLGLREGAYPEAERAAREVISLPIFPSMTEGQVARVSEVCRAVFS